MDYKLYYTREEQGDVKGDVYDLWWTPVQPGKTENGCFFASAGCENAIKFESRPITGLPLEPGECVEVRLVRVEET